VRLQPFIIDFLDICKSESLGGEARLQAFSRGETRFGIWGVDSRLARGAAGRRAGQKVAETWQD